VDLRDRDRAEQHVLVPALAAAWQAVAKVADPVAPAVWPLVLTAGGAALVNGACALLLALRCESPSGRCTGPAPRPR
jgi:hypothetical protein